mgnify:CR=1 FL=1
MKLAPTITAREAFSQALMMALESVSRLFESPLIHFNEAIMVASVGLVVNLVCAFLLQDHHVHDASGDHDHNLRAAYLHVLADALTSVLAIAALLGLAVAFLGVLLSHLLHAPVIDGAASVVIGGVAAIASRRK